MDFCTESFLWNDYGNGRGKCVGYIDDIVGANVTIQKQSFEIIMDEIGSDIISISDYGICSDFD